jgi:hypothetical protein
MALRMLSFDGQQALHGDDLTQWPALGIYWRIGVNAVSAFRGSRLEVDDWVRLFSHYVNLQLVDRILRLVEWRAERLGQETSIAPAGLRRAALALSIEPDVDVLTFGLRVREKLAAFEGEINGIVRSVPEIPLSMLGSPLRYLLEALQDDLAFGGRFLTICLDEFENLEDYQQRVFNTLLKHVGDAPYTFKIGVKPTGLRDRHTLNAHESIGEVADYSSLEIVAFNKSQNFSDFAARVCDERLQLFPAHLRPTKSIRDLFPDLAEEQEAVLLGVDRRLAGVREALVLQGAEPNELREFDAMSRLSAYLVHYWAQSKFSSELAVLREAIRKPGAWKTRLGNYSYTMLFTLQGRVGPTLRKHYAGWSTYVALADGNIRYLLDLVSSALVDHVSQEQDLSEPVAPAIQTRAAQKVGEKLVFDLEGQDDLGKQVMRVVLGLGRVFGVMASDPYGHAPEVSQFRIDKTFVDDPAFLERLVAACEMHSGFVSFPGDKRASKSGETRDRDYQLHPIFSPYFLYTHRRKRRMTVTANEVAALSDRVSTNQTIEQLLRRNRRVLEQFAASELPGFGELESE